jgi:glycosyltransferase involved in cell wall biosynthesis
MSVSSPISADRVRAGRASPPVVSVITPTFNRARWLKETIESIRAQDYTAIEHIVVDDGSTDETEEIVRSIAPRDGYRLLYAWQKNCGEANAVNHGWSLASGEFVAVVNSDDPQSAHWLRVCVDALLGKKDAVVAYPDWQAIDDRGRVIAVHKLGPYDRRRLFRRAECLPGPGALIRRSRVPIDALRREGLYHLSDFDCWLRLALIGDFINVPEMVAVWRAHADGLSETASIRARTEEALRIIDDFYRNPELPVDIASHYPSARGHISYQCVRIAWRAAPWLALRHLARAICLLGPRGEFPLWHVVTAAFRQAPGIAGLMISSHRRAQAAAQDSGGSAGTAPRPGSNQCSR